MVRLAQTLAYVNQDRLFNFLLGSGLNLGWAFELVIQETEMDVISRMIEQY